MAFLFLFGAGASYGSGACSPYPPPLGRDLFEELRKRGGEAAIVDPSLARLFASDFEAGMDQFLHTREGRVPAFLREMAGYFALFEPLAGNCYRKLVEIIANVPEKATFASLNYDLLLEIAASQAGFPVVYSGLPVRPGNIPVLKIHGSCNFLPYTGSNIVIGNSFEGFAGSGMKAIMQAPIRAEPRATNVIEYCRHEGNVPPAIALYAKGKRLLVCPTDIQKQQSQWASSVDGASAVYVIGAKVHPIDEHVWEPLAKTHAPVYYVGLDPQAFLSWAAHCRNNGGESHVLAESFQAALPLIESSLGA